MNFRHIYKVLLALVMLLSASVAHGAEEHFDIDYYNRLSSRSTPDLMALGQQFLQEKMMVDSALVCYTIVSNREHDKKMNREMLHLVARAKNNLGYIYGAHYYDYPKSYENLNRAIQLSEEYGFDDIASYAYMNLASTMNGRNDLFGDDSFSTEVFENTKLAFNKAVQAKEWNVAVTCLFNALAMMNENDDIHSIKSELDRFERLQSIDGVEMWQCTRMFCEGVQAYHAGRYQQALDYYVKMEQEAHRLQTNRQKCILMAKNQQSVVFVAMHRYQDAIAILKKIESIAQETGLESDLINAYHSMVDVYNAMGNHQQASVFEYKYLKARDEFIKKSNAEKLEKARFLDEMRRVNDQVAEIELKRERAHQLSLMMSLIAAIILIALILLVRSYLKQRNYIRHLYEKNVQLLASSEVVPQSIVVDSVEPSDIHDESAPKYQGTTLDQESKDRLFAQIKQVMDNMSVICQPNFSLQSLADRVGSNYKYVSQVVNEYYGKSFKQVLNEQRVREACRQLNDTEQFGHLTIEAIAANLGFNSRSNFTVTFKRITGISPSEFLKMARENSGA
ncbi:MAG: AraC family transcriptional regulator [Muribaculaceae bacterium]|nr:AraC family transcriptional regulator [Muribaculaceae bacterium]